MEEISKKIGGLVLASTCLGVCVTAAPAAAYNVYYGHLHNHSTISDGSGSPSAAYSYARDTAGLDFFSLADHASAISSSEWTTMKNTANSYNDDGTFVAFWGFEWSSGTYGHVTIINTDTGDYCTKNDSDANTFDKLVSWLDNNGGVAFFNHPGREGSGEFNNFASTPSDKFVGMELFNKSADFGTYYYNDGYYSNDGNLGYFDEALIRGWDIGAAGGDDHHGTNWGTTTEFRLAVLADNLTRASIYEALQARRMFSTLDMNIDLSFTINGQEMGSVLDSGSYSGVIDVIDGDGENFTRVELLKNGQVAQTWYPNQSNPVINFSVNATDGDYYYVRVKQSDNDEAISSPISFTGAGSGNIAPTADAGADQSVTDTDENGSEQITLNGSGSNDSDGNIVSYSWEEGGVEIATGANPSVTLDVGSHTIDLIVTDDQGATGTDTVFVTVLDPSGETTVSSQVSSSLDDVEERGDGTMYTNSSDLELVYDGSNQNVGMRFNNINVPQGAVITDAYIQFTVDEANSGTTNLTITGHDTDDAAAFTTSSNNVSNRATTSASVSWNPVAWNTVGAAGADQRTPNLKNIVQEIVNRGGWSAYNSMVLMISGTGERTAESYDGSSANAPELVITYAGGGTANVAPTAHAGADQTVTDNDDNGSEQVTLNGSASSDSDGTISSYVWKKGGSQIATGENPTVSLAVGTHTIELTVTDDEGATDTDTVVVTVNPAPGNDPVTISKRIASGGDDVEQEPDGSMYSTSSDIELVYDNYVGGIQTVGLRFTGLNIPQGATITNATIQFTVDETDSGTTNLTIKAHDTDDAPAFTTAAYNVSSRTKTSASVNWSPAAWTSVGAAGADQRTPDLKNVVQEVVNRGGWNSGNDMVFIITGTGERTAESYNGSSSKAALLSVTYTE